MLLYWVWLSQLPHLQAWQKLSLLQQFHDPEGLYNATPRTLSQKGLTDPAVQTALAQKELSEARNILRVCEEKNIRIIPLQDAAYPRRLRNTQDPPLVLYCLGALPELTDRPVIGVVGTRKATPYGLTVAKRFSAQITACGGLIVSGGAIGIDTMALEGALSCGKPVVAVLAGGVDVPYPKSNAPLFARILKNGCLISEYPPGTAHLKWHFPQRNRIISGISNGVLVVEAPEISGALITARKALEQGRDVFAVPGNIDTASCAGSNALLQGQATPVFSGWDVMKEYLPLYPGKVTRTEPPADILTPEPVKEPRLAEPVRRPKAERSAKLPIDNEEKSTYSVLDNPLPALTEEENAVVSQLTEFPKAVDAVIAAAGIAPNRVLSVLTRLAVKGVVANHPGGQVSLKKRSGGKK